MLGGCQKRITKHGVAASMRAKGNCYDNSKVETFFKTITAELIWRTRWETRCQAEGAIFQHINGPYNPRHHQSSLGGKSPWPLNERLHKCVGRPERKRDKTKYTCACLHAFEKVSETKVGIRAWLI